MLIAFAFIAITSAKALDSQCLDTWPYCHIFDPPCNNTEVNAIEFCPKHCGICQSEISEGEGCMDKVDCRDFKLDEGCKSNNSWFSEYCPLSCHLCSTQNTSTLKSELSPHVLLTRLSSVFLLSSVTVSIAAVVIVVCIAQYKKAKERKAYVAKQWDFQQMMSAHDVEEARSDHTVLLHPVPHIYTSGPSLTHLSGERAHKVKELLEKFYASQLYPCLPPATLPGLSSSPEPNAAPFPGLWPSLKPNAAPFPGLSSSLEPNAAPFPGLWPSLGPNAAIHPCLSSSPKPKATTISCSEFCLEPMAVDGITGIELTDCICKNYREEGEKPYHFYENIQAEVGEEPCYLYENIETERGEKSRHLYENMPAELGEKPPFV